MNIIILCVNNTTDEELSNLVQGILKSCANDIDSKAYAAECLQSISNSYRNNIKLISVYYIPIF